MNVGQAQIHDLENEKSLSLKLLKSKFEKYSKEKFLGLVKEEKNSIEYFKKINQHYSLNLPAPFDEYPILKNNFSRFLISGIPLLIKAERGLNSQNKSHLTSTLAFKEIKSIYSKWLNIKGGGDKQFYAESAIKMIEQCKEENNILILWMHASILTFDPSIYSYSNALEIVDEVNQKIQSLGLSEGIKKEFHYINFLLQGFIYLQSKDNEKAFYSFDSAIRIKPEGMTSILYSAYLSLLSNDKGNSIALIGKLIKLDIDRLSLAFKLNNIRLFNYFIENALIYLVFQISNFANILDEIDEVLSLNFNSHENRSELVSKKLSDFENLMIDEYYDDEVRDQINFMNEFLETYHSNKHYLVYISNILLPKKFNEIIEGIKNIINEANRLEVEQKLALFDNNINNNSKSIQYYHKEKDEEISRIKKSEQEYIVQLETHYENAIANVEYKIENIDSNKKYDPSANFHSYMVYNFVIATVVFVIGGLVNGFFGSESSYYESSELLIPTLISGIKWGGLTFFIGIFVSLLASASSMWERSNMKQRFLKNINILKTQKDQQIKDAKTIFKERLTNFEENTRIKVNELEKLIKNLKHEKEERRIELHEIAEKKNEQDITNLNSLLINLN